MRDQSSRVSRVKRVKMVVKMLWKRSGSDFRNSARRTTEKRTGGCSGSCQAPIPYPCAAPSCSPPPPPPPLTQLLPLPPWCLRPRPSSTAQDTHAGKHEDKDGCNRWQGLGQSPCYFLKAGQDAVGRGGEGGCISGGGGGDPRPATRTCTESWGSMICW